MTRSVEIPEAERERAAGVLHGFEHDRLHSRCPGSDECELWYDADVRAQRLLSTLPYLAPAEPEDRERVVELLKAELPSAYRFMAWSLVETLSDAGVIKVGPPACAAALERHPEWGWGPCVFTAGHHEGEGWTSHADRLGRTWNDQPAEEGT